MEKDLGMKPFAKLRSLLEKSTPGQWRIGHVEEGDREWADIDGPELSLATVFHRTNQAYICEARNQLPAILEALDVAVLQLSDICQIESGCEDFRQVPKGEISELFDDCFEALEKIKQLGAN